MALLTLEDQIGAMPGLTAVETLAVVHWPAFRTNGGHLPTETASGPVLTPIVNHGRWVVRCPFCPSANRASAQDRRFLCCECGNAGCGGKWLPVRFPDDSGRIERLLEQRPDRHTRNWVGEDVAVLAEENNTLIGGVEL
jgi:hypothetical protein